MIHILLPLTACLWMVTLWARSNPALTVSRWVDAVYFGSAYAGGIAIATWLNVVIRGAL